MKTYAEICVLITRDYGLASQQGTLRWSLWDSLTLVRNGTPHWHYRKIQAPRCRQCRNLPQDSRWTGDRRCVCGNPYVNQARLPRWYALHYVRGPYDWNYVRRDGRVIHVNESTGKEFPGSDAYTFRTFNAARDYWMATGAQPGGVIVEFESGHGSRIVRRVEMRGNKNMSKEKVIA